MSLLPLLPLLLAAAQGQDTQSPECGHPLDCSTVGDGWWADPHNCRKFWHCYEGVAHHLACEDDMMFDLAYNGCNFEWQTDCGDRPICGPCDTDCVTQHPPKPDPDCGGHPLDCSLAGPGLHPDSWNCRKYWNCDNQGNGFHIFCDDGLLFTEAYGGACDWAASVDCGDRPVCDDCDQNCHSHHP